MNTQYKPIMWIVLTLSAVLGCGSILTPASAQGNAVFVPGDAVVIDAQALTLYTATDISADRIIGLPVGTKLHVTSGPVEKDGLVWWRVRGDAGQGWIEVGHTAAQAGSPTLIPFDAAWATQSIADHTLILANDPGNAGSLFGRAMLYFALEENDDDALADFTAAIALEPDNAYIYHARGLTYYWLERYTEAIADYTTAIGLNPSEAVFYNSRGNAYW